MNTHKLLWFECDVIVRFMKLQVQVNMQLIQT